MTLKIHDLKEIIKIANLLDKKRLFKEADILDQIIIKLSRESDQKYVDLTNFFILVLENYLNNFFSISPGNNDILINLDLKRELSDALYSVYTQYTENQISEFVFKDIFSKLRISIIKTKDSAQDGSMAVKNRILSLYIPEEMVEVIEEQYKNFKNKIVDWKDTEDLLSVSHAIIDIKKEIIIHEITHLINYTRTIENLNRSNKTMLCSKCKSQVSPTDSFCQNCGAMTTSGLFRDQWGKQRVQGLYQSSNEQGLLTQEYIDSTEEIQARLIQLINSKKNDPQIIKSLVEQNPRQFINEITKDLEGWTKLSESSNSYSQEQKNRIIGRLYQVYTRWLQEYNIQN